MHSREVPYFSQWESPEANVTLPLASFDRFFARRGIAVGFQP